ncbi:MAG: preprotein translocase subunit SecY [Candidatus Eisenbacteria bacterium]|nr:preprotein translocase subunit SecY [Candidatus Eisenbacteria bacterium]
MPNIFTSLTSIFKIPELKRRVLYTLMMLCVYRAGGHIPTAGVNGRALAAYFTQQQGSLLGLYDMFVGGAFANATIFALGIMPYISASIILQLFTAVVPYFEKLQKMGEEGRKKITQYTRYGTVGLSLLQSYALSAYLQGLPPVGGIPIVPFPGIGFTLLTMLTMTTGTIFIMWLGEQIQEKGIGNGISLIIFIGIVARYPSDWLNTYRSMRIGSLNVFSLVILVLVMIGIVAAVVLMTQAQRRIPVQYAKRVVGRKMYGGQSTHIPLRLNTAGVIPVIFAQSIIMLPGTVATFFKGNLFMETVAAMLRPGGWLYNILYLVIIVFFAYFYTAIVFNPVDLADNMKKYGGFVPGKRPGKSTAEYIDSVLTRVTLPGALFLAFIAILPYFLMEGLSAPFYFGGTGLLIVVGVALDTLGQVESHMLMRHYDGFLAKGKLRGRRSS